MTIAGRLAMPSQSIDHSLYEGQLNDLGIGRFDLFHSASSDQPHRVVVEAGEAQCSRCSDDLNLICVLERVEVPDTDTFYIGMKAEDSGDQVFGSVASTAVRSDSGRMGSPDQVTSPANRGCETRGRRSGHHPRSQDSPSTRCRRPPSTWAGRSLRMMTDRS